MHDHMWANVTDLRSIRGIGVELPMPSSYITAHV